jgi:hypothetical protein
MESIVPGVEDRGGNDHYALRGRLAWQPGDATDVDLIFRYLEADGETQAGLYSHEPACPNAQFQGEFTAPTQSCAFWGSGPGQTGTGFEEPSIIPSRGGDPYKTAETEPSYVDREVFGAQLRIDTDIGAGTFTSITDYQTSDKFYTEGGDSSPDDGVYFFQGSDLDQISQEFRYAWSVGDHQMVAGLFGMDVDGEYIGKFASRFYGYDPDVSFTQETTSFAVFFQDEWSFAERWKLVGGLSTGTTRAGFVLRQRASDPGLASRGHDHLQPGRDLPARELGYHQRHRPVVRRHHRAAAARLPAERRPALVPFIQPRQQERRILVLGRHALRQQLASSRGSVFEPETLNAYELGMKSSLAGGTVMLNMAAFYYDYKDYQAFAQLGPIQTVINQDAEAMGLEIELNAYPTDRLMLQLGASFMDSEVKDITLPDLATVVDNDLPQAPPFAANALARYEFPLGAGTASVQGDVYYTDDFCFTTLRAGGAGGLVHGRQRAHRLCRTGRALGSRGFREQRVRGGIPRVRLRRLAVRGCGQRRVRKAAHVWGDGNLSFWHGIRLACGPVEATEAIFQTAGPLRCARLRRRPKRSGNAWSRHPASTRATPPRADHGGGRRMTWSAAKRRPRRSGPVSQQVLASFGTVWSRSRLMRIAGGGAVPQHSDMNYHWFHRVRVHIPVVTRSEVRFHCGGQDVHMAAGEAWIFDNWRSTAENSQPRRACTCGDTVGTRRSGGSRPRAVAGLRARRPAGAVHRLRRRRGAAAPDRAHQRHAGDAALGSRSTCGRPARRSRTRRRAARVRYGS